MQKNILLIFTDQQRFDTIEALGNPIIKTPAINRLVKNGVSFDRAYTPCPVCIPARFAMHTGLMPHKTDCVINETMPDGYDSFMDVLSRNGYQTHGVGKMHFEFDGKGADTPWGFESRDFSEEGGMDDDFKSFLKDNGYDHVHDPQGIRSEMYYIPQPSQLPQRHHNSTWVADRSIDFLNNRDTSRPFMMMTSFIKPHPPFESPTPWNKLYRGPEMPLPKRPENSAELTTYWNRFQNRYKYKDQGIDDQLMKTMKAAYYGTISFLDYNIGKLLDHMEEQGLMDNTLIVFSADHGEMLGDYNCVGKRCFLDSAARVPLIMVHPDGERGKVCTTPASLIDIMPTFLQYADIEGHKDLCGESLLDIAENKLDRSAVFGQYHRDENGLYMMVMEGYKYIYSAPDQKEWLFDLNTDSAETVNYAQNPLYIHQTEDMRSALIDYLKNDGYESPFISSNSGLEFRKYTVKKMPEDSNALLLFQDAPESLPHIPGYERDTKYSSGDLFKDGF